MKSFIPTLAAACFALSTGLAFAQTTTAPAPSAEGGMHHHATPEQREKFRADMKAAREACKDSADKRGCVTSNICSKQADPAKCQEHARKMGEHHAKRMDEHQAVAEACTGKRGDALQQCYKEHHSKRKPANPAAPATKG